MSGAGDLQVDGCEPRPIAYSHFRFEVEGDMSRSLSL